MMVITGFAWGNDYGQIYGSVQCTKSATALVAVNVYLKNTHIGSATDKNGFYTIEKIPAGKYEIVVEMIGYRQLQRKFVSIYPGENLELNFKLQPVTIVFDNGITVTATRGHSLITEVPASVDVINSDAIESKNAQNVAEALQNVKGVFVKDYGGLGNTKTISLRGSTAGQVLVMLDGQRLNNPQTGQVDLSMISMEGIERIEVVRGGNSALYGSDAVGGVINLITKKSDRENQEVTGSFKVGTASFGTGTIEPSVKFKKMNSSVFASFKYLESKGNFDFVDNYGNEKTRLNSDIISRNYYVSWDQNFGDPHYQRNFSISLKHYNSSRGTPGTIEPYYYNARMWDKNNQANVIYSGKIINLFNDIRLQLYYHDSYNRYKNDETSQIIDSEFFTQTRGNEIQMKSVIGPQVSMTYGTGLRYDWMKNPQIKQENERKSYYLFLLNESILCVNNILQTISFVPSLRYDYNSDYTNKVSPKLGMVMNFGEAWKSSLKFNIGKSYRAPTFNDLYWPEDTWTKGNPELEPEYGSDWDVGIRLQYPILNGIYIESSYFENRMNRLILWQEEKGFWTPQNVNKSRIQGLENSIQIEPVRDFLDITANYTFLDARNLSDEINEYNKILIYRPKHTVNIGVNFKYKILNAGYQFNYTSRRYTNPTNVWANSLDPYFVSDLSISFKPTFSSVKMNFSFQIKNIFNEDYRIIKNMPIPGREYRFSVKTTI